MTFLIQGGVCTRPCRAVYRNFAKGGGGGRIWGMDKRGGGGGAAEAQWYHVRCYTLGGGARMTQGGAPLKYGPAMFMEHVICRHVVVM